MGFFKSDYTAKYYDVTVKFRFSDSRGIPYNEQHLIYLLGESLGYGSPVDKVYVINSDHFAIDVKPVEKK